jgi:hypothetical protein
VLLEVLLELDITRLSADLALFGANERGGGIRTRASLRRCKKRRCGYIQGNTNCEFDKTQKKTKTAPSKSTWFFSSLDMPDAALPEALEACSLQKVSTSNISTPSENEIRTR